MYLKKYGVMGAILLILTVVLYSLVPSLLILGWMIALCIILSLFGFIRNKVIRIILFWFLLLLWILSSLLVFFR